MSTPSVSATALAALVGSLDGERPAYRTLAERLRLLIVDGRVLVGTRLPSERELTTALAVSRTTVTRAYAVLRASGYARARHGSGTTAHLPSGRIRRGTGASLFPAEVGEDVLDLTCAATRAPHGVAEAYAAALEALPAYLAGAGYLTLGVRELREAIADRYSARGVPTRADEVLVTSGAVAAMAVATRAFVHPGDRVLLETPTYPNTVESLRRMGARLSAVPVHPSGWDSGTMLTALRTQAPRAAVLIPDFHNPTGAFMPEEQRAELAAAMRREGTVALVDETIAEVRLDDGATARPFAAHHGDTVTIGSASKSHWGGLRLGWLRARPELLAHLLDARVTIDLGAPVLEQLVLLHLMRQSPGLAPERRAELVEARDAAVAAVRRELPDVDLVVPSGGLCLWLHLPSGSASRVVEAAEDEGLLLASGNRFAVTGTLERWVRLPYVLPPAQLEEAVARLARGRARAERTAYAGRRRSRSSGPGPLVA